MDVLTDISLFIAASMFIVICILTLNGNLKMECDKIPGKFDSCKIVYKRNTK